MSKQAPYVLVAFETDVYWVSKPTAAKTISIPFICHMHGMQSHTSTSVGFATEAHLVILARYKLSGHFATMPLVVSEPAARIQAFGKKGHCFLPRRLSAVLGA